MLDSIAWSVTFAQLSDAYVPRVDWPDDRRRVFRPLDEVGPRPVYHTAAARRAEVLAVLRKSDRPLRISELRELLDGHPSDSTIGVVLKELRDLGLVESPAYARWRAILFVDREVDVPIPSKRKGRGTGRKGRIRGSRSVSSLARENLIAAVLDDVPRSVEEITDRSGTGGDPMTTRRALIRLAACGLAQRHGFRSGWSRAVHDVEVEEQADEEVAA